MTRLQANRLSGRTLIGLSLIALFTVLYGYSLTPQPDEGAPAHIFQITIVLLLPTLLFFFATADWNRPLHSARALLFSAATLAVAFGALYHLEHYR